MKGFTLIEILIVVAIVGILAAVAYPSYQNSVQKSRRTDAKSALMDTAALQEKWYFQFNQYTTDIDALKGCDPADDCEFTPEGYYQVTITQPCGDTSCYTLTADAVGAQLGDTSCLAFTLTHRGDKSGCW